MSAPKNLSRFGLLAKLESTYGTFAAPVTTGADSVLVVERPDVDPDWMNDGARGHASLKRVKKSGRFGTLPAVQEAAGYGAAYSAANFPNIHQLMRASGYNVTTVVTGGAESQTYAPTLADAVPGSVSLEAYARGQMSQLAGALGKVVIEGENGGIPRWAFDLMGILHALPADAALPAITYAGSHLIDPAKLIAPGMTIGAFTPTRLKSFRFEDNRAIANRSMENSAERHGGFQEGFDRPFTLNVVIESVALATYNAYNLAELCDNRVVTIPVGATQYRRWRLVANNAQLIDTPEQDENNAAMWELQFELKPSAFMLRDNVSFIFD